MEPRYVETKQGLALIWAGSALFFGIGFSLVMGSSGSDALLFGVAIGLGVGIGSHLFFKPDE